MTSEDIKHQLIISCVYVCAVPEEPDQAVSARARAAPEVGGAAGGDPPGALQLDGAEHEGAARVRGPLHRPRGHLRQRDQEPVAGRSTHEEAREAGPHERQEEAEKPGPDGGAAPRPSLAVQARQDSPAPRQATQGAAKPRVKMLPELESPPGRERGGRKAGGRWGEGGRGRWWREKEEGGQVGGSLAAAH